MFDSLISFLLVGIMFSILCHGHSRNKLLRPSLASAFLSCFFIMIMTAIFCPGGLIGVIFVFFPMFLIISLIVGLIYKMIRYVAFDKRQIATCHNNLETPEKDNTALKKFWKIAFWTIFAIYVLGYFEACFRTKFSSMWDWIDIFLILVAMVGFFLYAYQKKMGNAYFWRLFAVFFIGWDFYIKTVIQGHHEVIRLPLLILLPMYVSLILYGFRFHQKAAINMSCNVFSDKFNLTDS